MPNFSSGCSWATSGFLNRSEGVGEIVIIIIIIIAIRTTTTIMVRNLRVEVALKKFVTHFPRAVLDGNPLPSKSSSSSCKDEYSAFFVENKLLPKTGIISSHDEVYTFVHHACAGVI